MGVAEALGRGVERLGSGRAALAYWRAVLATSPAPSAFRAALRIALVHDRAAVAELVPLWATIPVNGSAPELVDACKDLVRVGMRADAEALAALEVARARTARALYLWARCSTRTVAAARFAETIARATSEGAMPIVAAARRRRAELLAERWDTLAEAVAEASAIDLASASPAERLAIARVLLLASSRFVRATAIGVLDELVTTERADRTLAPAALHLAARFADDAAFALTPLEVERLRALFGRPFAVAHAPGAVAVLAVREPEPNAHNARAHDITSGRFEPPHASASPEDRVLDAAAALRDAAKDGGARAAHLLRELATAPITRSLLAVAHAALAGEHAEARVAALPIVRAHLARPTSVAPPRGYTALAQALVAAGAPDLAEGARHAALVAREPGANDALVLSLARAGWELAASDRAAAIAKLREARQFASAVPIRK